MTGRGPLKLISLISAAVLLAALPAVSLAQAGEPAATQEPVAAAAVLTLAGAVTHGSGGVVPAELPVTLRVISPQMTETVIEAAVDAAGAFSFADVAIYPDHIYVATVDYEGGQFASAVLRGSQLLTETPNLAITLYEFTDDPAALAVEALQSQVAVSLNELQVLDLYRFTNSGDRAFRMADGGSVRVNIPENATLVDMGAVRFMPSADGQQLIDTAPVLPGEGHTLHVLYTLPYGGAATVSHVVDYPLLNGFQVMVATPGLAVSGDGIEPLDDSGVAFGVPASLPAGALVNFTVAGVPEAAPAAAPAGTVIAPATAESAVLPPLPVILMVLGGACIGIAAVLFVRERRRPATVPADAGDPRVSALVQQIAELDVAFQAGTITQETYEAQRNALKAQLLSLARGSKTD